MHNWLTMGAYIKIFQKMLIFDEKSDVIYFFRGHKMALFPKNAILTADSDYVMLYMIWKYLRYFN